MILGLVVQESLLQYLVCSIFLIRLIVACPVFGLGLSILYGISVNLHNEMPVSISLLI